MNARIMKKLFAAALAVSLISASLLSAQADATGQSSLADPDPNAVGSDSAASSVREVSLDLFEREGSWRSTMSSDYGVISSRLFEGKPGKDLNRDKPVTVGGTPVPDDKVLGAKVQFFRRGTNTFYIKAVQPIPVEGTVKTVSFWVAGRNQDHTISLLVRDYYQRDYELYVGDLAFSGWKKLTVTIPPSPDGERGIVQSTPYYGDHPGLSIVGFKIDCNPIHARGSYYLYIDDLRAYTDLYDYENRHDDDLTDNW